MQNRRNYLILLLVVLTLGIGSRYYFKPTGESGESTEVAQSLDSSYSQSKVESEESSEVPGSNDLPSSTEEASDWEAELKPVLDESLVTVNLADILDLQFEGYTGEGTVTYAFNQPVIQQALGLSDAELAVFMGAIDLQIEPDSGLKNGDRVQVSLEAGAYQKHINGNPRSIQVSGLDAYEIINEADLAANLALDISGYSGSAEAQLKVSEQEPYTHLTFEQHFWQEVANGDQLALVLTAEAEDWLQEHGYQLEKPKMYFQVGGLPERERLSQELLERHVVASFQGTSGAGEIMLDTTFQPPFSDFLDAEAFDIPQQGRIANGDTVELLVKADVRQALEEAGYALETDRIMREAGNLKEVAEHFDEIHNHEAIFQRIQEDLRNQFPDTFFGAYEIEPVAYYYRPHRVVNDLLDLENVSQDGTFIGLFQIQLYDRQKTNLRSSQWLVHGYTDLFINNQQEVALDDMETYHYEFPENYTLESAKQLLEGYGFEREIVD